MLKKGLPNLQRRARKHSRSGSADVSGQKDKRAIRKLVKKGTSRRIRGEGSRGDNTQQSTIQALTLTDHR